MNDREHYFLENEKQQNRYDTLAEMSSSLDADLALARTLAERAANAGHDGLSATILGIVAKLSSANTQNKIRQGELLERKAVVFMARVLAEITADEVQDKFPDWQDCLVRISDRYEDSLKNNPLQLEDHR